MKWWTDDNKLLLLMVAAMLLESLTAMAGFVVAYGGMRNGNSLVTVVGVKVMLDGMEEALKWKRRLANR